MYYVIQENLFKEFHYNTLVDYLKRYNLEYETVPFRPFVDVLEVKTERKDVWFFGSVNAARMAVKNDWNPGSMYNENHDFEVYGPKYGTNLLNFPYYIAAADEIDFSKHPFCDIPYAFFARPSKDSKAFSGQLFTKDSWKEYIDELKANSSLGHLTGDTKVLIAPLRSNIQQELRCWIVDGKIVTISQYKIGSRVVYQNQDNNEEVTIFVNKMLKIYQPARAFVMDVCLSDNDYKIVEINCINCSGFYDGDMSKLIQSLEEAFSI